MNSPPPSGNRRPRRSAVVLRPASYDESQYEDPPGLTKRKRPKTLESLQKETHTEALISLSLGFPVDALLPAETLIPPPPNFSLNDYIVLRNHILATWRSSVRSFLSITQLKETVSVDYDSLLSAAYSFLSENGYINFGLIKNLRFPPEDEPDKGAVIVIGSGLSGLAAARQLINFGFKVLVLEGKDRPGGRVYTSKLGQDGKFASVDLGGSVITGINANPLGVLARQLGIPLHKIRDKCPLFHPDGTNVDEKLDLDVDSAFNKLLDKATQLREAMGEFATEISLGSAIEKMRRLYGVAKGKEEKEVLDWHLANLEYANAGCLSDLSLAHWDQDDPYEMDGDHCFLAGGNWRLIGALCENVPILYGEKVVGIKYGDSEVEVAVEGGQVFQADMVLSTVSLGVLKSKSIKFDPELPAKKTEAIERLGFGLLNKIAMVFPYVFWGEELDTFGCLNTESSRRGEFFLFYAYHTVSGGAVLIALVAGEAALEFERTDPVVLLHRVLGVIRGIFKPRGVDVPDPVQSVCTKWGEATNRQHPATMHGAFLSGLREAASILHAWRNRTSGNNDPKRCSQKNSRICNDLIDLFKVPDVAFGNFEFVFDPFTTEDLKAIGLVRFTFRKPETEALEKYGFEQQSKELQQLSGRLCQPFHFYAILSREQMLQIQLVSEDDKSKLGMPLKKFGLKLMGFDSACTLGSSLIISISSARKAWNKQCRAMHH